jgi:hypothetical protein
MKRKYVKTFEKFNSVNEDRIKEGYGIEFQSDFTQEEQDMIEERVLEEIADKVEEGYVEGELHGEENPDFDGWWKIEIEEDDESEEVRLNYIADKIREGYSSGYYPTFHWIANIWK